MEDKLHLEKNGIKVQVVESSIINGKEQLIVGNYERDLILRTKGNLRIQVQNKFYDLLSREFLDENGDISTGIVFVTNVQGQTFDDQILVVETSTGKVYYTFNGNLVEIGGSNSLLGNYVSYSEPQNLSDSQKLLALKNIGYVYNQISDVNNVYNNQLVYLTSANKHYFYRNNNWIESYLHLLDGGIVKGNTTFSSGSSDRIATVGIYPMTTQSHTLNNLSSYNGLFVGINNINKGLGIYNDNANSYINTHGNNNIIIRINNSNNTSYKDIMNITEEGIGINSMPNPLYFLNIQGGTITDNITFSSILKTSNINSPIYGKAYDYEYGISGISDDTDEWIFATDKLIVKNPDSNIKIEGISGQKYVRNTYHVLNYYEGDGSTDYQIEVSNGSGLIVGDILMGVEYNWNGTAKDHFLLEVTDIEVPSDSESPWFITIELVSPGEFHTFKNYELVKVDHTSDNIYNVLLDGQTKNIKIVSDLDLSSVPDSGDENPVYDRPSFNNIELSLGNLNEVVDLDFNLNGNNEFGLYSTNSYIKGEANLSKLVLGNQLNWNGTTLTIADLETIKNRTITGSNGLTGGGTLFTSNIVISHANGSWTSKTNLSGSQVISNLSVDTYGHLTNWTLRDLTAADIGAASSTINITAGNGLTGGGSLAASRTITMGTPSSITLSSTNIVTSTSHAHAFEPGGTTSQYIRGDGSLATMPTISGGTVTSISTGPDLTGGPITTSGTIGFAPRVSSWINDQQGNPRLYFGNDTTTTTNLILRLSNAAATASFDIRNSANSSIFRIDASGTLQTGSIPWARVSDYPSIIAGNGLSGGGSLSGTGATVTLGTPGTITGSTTNAVTSTSHTHSLTLASADITGALGFTPVTTARTITLTGGTGISVSTGAQNLSANRSWTITNSAPNATHTGDVTGSAALTIANSAVTNAKMANMVADRIKGRIGSTGAPQDLTPVQARGALGITTFTGTFVTDESQAVGISKQMGFAIAGVQQGDIVCVSPRDSNWILGLVMQARAGGNQIIVSVLNQTTTALGAARSIVFDAFILKP